MNINVYDDSDCDVDDEFNEDIGIQGFEIAYVSTNTKTIRKSARQKHRVREKLHSLHEKRYLDRQLNTLSDYWEM